MAWNALLPLMVVLFGCGEPTESPADAVEIEELLPEDPAVQNGLWTLPHLWWRPALPVLCTPWAGIVGGTVTQIRVHDDDWGPPEKPDRRRGLHEGTVEVQQVFRHHDGTRFRFPSAPKLLRADGFEGVHVGDRVLVFIGHHEGAFALSGIREGDFPLGFKVNGWTDPRVTTLVGDDALTPLDRARISPEQRKLWYPSGALDCNPQ